MVIVDVNLLIHAVHMASPDHARVRAWLQTCESIGLPWIVLVGFVRVSTNPRLTDRPYTLDQALHQVHDWLALPNATIVHPGLEHARYFAEQCRAANATGNLVTDAHLAALAIEHDCELASNDTDFARFPHLRWINPLAAAA